MTTRIVICTRESNGIRCYDPSEQGKWRDWLAPYDLNLFIWPKQPIFEKYGVLALELR